MHSQLTERLASNFGLQSTSSFQKDQFREQFKSKFLRSQLSSDVILYTLVLDAAIKLIEKGIVSPKKFLDAEWTFIKFKRLTNELIIRLLLDGIVTFDWIHDEKIDSLQLAMWLSSLEDPCFYNILRDKQILSEHFYLFNRHFVHYLINDSEYRRVFLDLYKNNISHRSLMFLCSHMFEDMSFRSAVESNKISLKQLDFIHKKYMQGFDGQYNFLLALNGLLYVANDLCTIEFILELPLEDLRNIAQPNLVEIVKYNEASGFTLSNLIALKIPCYYKILCEYCWAIKSLICNNNLNFYEFKKIPIGILQEIDNKTIQEGSLSYFMSDRVDPRIIPFDAFKDTIMKEVNKIRAEDDVTSSVAGSSQAADCRQKASEEKSTLLTSLGRSSIEEKKTSTQGSNQGRFTLFPRVVTAVDADQPLPESVSDSHSTAGHGLGV